MFLTGELTKKKEAPKPSHKRISTLYANKFMRLADMLLCNHQIDTFQRE